MLSTPLFLSDFLHFAGNEENHKVSDKFEIRPDPTMDCGFYPKYHWDGGKAALSFGPDRIRTLVFVATDSSHRVIMEKMLSTF